MLPSARLRSPKSGGERPFVEGFEEASISSSLGEHTTQSILMFCGSVPSYSSFLNSCHETLKRCHLSISVSISRYPAMKLEGSLVRGVSIFPCDGLGTPARSSQKHWRPQASRRRGRIVELVTYQLPCGRRRHIYLGVWRPDDFWRFVASSGLRLKFVENWERWQRKRGVLSS